MFTYGFYNSKNNDRTYDATQFGSIFDGVINDGIYMSIGDHFNVTPTTDGTLGVIVGSGRAWLDHTWTLNTTGEELTLEQSELIQDRIDAVVIDVDHREAYRRNTLMIIKGQKSTSPVRPTLTNDNSHKQYPLAYIRVKAGAKTLSQADITNMVGTAATPFVTGVLETIKIDTLVAKWEFEWDNKLADEETEFNNWFARMRTKLGDDTAGQIVNELSWMTKTISAADWSTSTIANLGDGKSYYTYTIQLNDIYADKPQIDRAPSGTNKVQTDDEADGFAQITPPAGWVLIDTDTKVMTLYAESKPTADFVIAVQGAD